jgi:hypothetical protein
LQQWNKGGSLPASVNAVFTRFIRLIRSAIQHLIAMPKDHLFPPLLGTSRYESLVASAPFSAGMLGTLVGLNSHTLTLAPISGYGYFIVIGPGDIAGAITKVLAENQALTIACADGEFFYPDSGDVDLTAVNAHMASTANPHGVTKAQVGLSAVENTSDANKPVSTAQAAAILAAKDRANHTGTQAIATVTGLQAALDAKAALASPSFSGTPTAPTAAPETNNQQLATTAFVWSMFNQVSASSTWGSIDGSIADQADLVEALDGLALDINNAESSARNRSNHTGTQAMATVTGLESALNSKAALDLTGVYPPLNAGCAHSTLTVAGSVTTEGTVTLNGQVIYFQKGGMAPYPQFRVDIDSYPYLGTMTKQQVAAFVVSCINSAPEVFACVAVDNLDGTSLVAAIEPGASGMSIATASALAGTSWTAAALGGINIFSGTGGTTGTAGVAGQAYTATLLPNTWVCVRQAPLYWKRLTSLTVTDVKDLVTQLSLKAPLSNAAFNGVCTAPTAALGTNTQQLATCAFVLANAPEVPEAPGVISRSAAQGPPVNAVRNFYETENTGDNNDIRFEQLDSGAAPTVQLSAGGFSAVTSVSVSGRTITVIASANIGMINKTAAEIIAAINGDPVASLMVLASNKSGSNGTGTMGANYGPWTLAGAVAGTAASVLDQACIVGDAGRNKLEYRCVQMTPVKWQLVTAGVIPDPNNAGQFLEFTVDGVGVPVAQPYSMS